MKFSYNCQIVDIIVRNIISIISDHNIKFILKIKIVNDNILLLSYIG